MWRLLQAGAGPFALRIWVVWAVCNASSLFGSSDTSGHGPEKLRKISGASTVPGTGCGGRDLPAFRFGITKVPGTGCGGRDLPAFRIGITKVPGTGCGGGICQHSNSRSRRCLAPDWQDHEGAWHWIGSTGLAVADRADRIDQRRRSAVPQVKPAPKPHMSASLPFCSLPCRFAS